MTTGFIESGVLDRLVAELKRDRKKAAVLGVLTAVCAVLSVRAYFSTSLPEPADAAALAASNAEREAQNVPAASDDSAEAKRLKYIKQIDRRITRDIFTMRTDFFQLAAPVVIKPVTTAQASQPAGPDPAERERNIIREQARRLDLQSTITGDSPIAIINNKVLRIGDVHAESGFRVVGITTHSCTVQKKDVLETLEMKTDR
ncbi:MAG: hypothetical protein ACE15C_05740 [Phycisphaerae bacterium]